MAAFVGPLLPETVRGIGTGIGSGTQRIVTGGPLAHLPPTPELIARSDTDFYSDDAREAMRDDDVASNGIFDMHVGPTVNRGDGVFADNPALPGYAYRESGLGPSETIDRQTGNAVEVYLPGTRTTLNFLPSSEPRWPWPGQDPYQPDLTWMQRSDFGTVPAAETAFHPLEDGVQVITPEPPTMTRGHGRAVAGLGGLGQSATVSGLGFLDTLEGMLGRVGLVGQVVAGGVVALGVLWLWDNYGKDAFNDLVGA